MCIICNLVESAKRKNQDSLMELLVRFKPLIKKHAYRLNYEDAENDLILNMIQIIYNMPVLKSDGQAVQYITQSIHHAYIKLMKEQIQLRKNEYLYDPEMMKNIEDLSNALTENNYLDLDVALEKLSYHQKWVIKYKFFYMLPDKDIMDKLKISRQSVYKNKINALKKLKQILKK